MAAPPPESSHSPPGTPISESTRPHSEHMEDTDLPATRKRPRLDSGSRVEESLSIDGACSTAAPAPEMDATPDSARPSKVTINMKSPTSEIPPEAARQASPNPESPSKAPEPDTLDNVISISSSPAQSPEIEVAEPEDMDQDPNTSTWRPLEEALQGQVAIPEFIEYASIADLLDEFPKLREDIPARDNLQRIGLLVDKCDPRDATLMSRVKIWMDDCVRNLDLLTSETFTDGCEFWENIPALVEVIMRRTQELQMDDGRGMWVCLEEFVLDYARLTMHIVQLDIQVWHTLSSAPDIQCPDCMSFRFLDALAWLLQIQNLPYWRVLDNLYDEEPRDLIRRVRATFITPDNTEKLVEFTSLILDNAARWPSLTAVLSSTLTLAAILLDNKHKQRPRDDIDAESPIDPIALQRIRQIISQVHEKWQSWITNKSTWAGSDLSESLVRQLGRANNLLCHQDEDFLHQLEKGLLLAVPEDLNTRDHIFLVVWGWKFGVLKRHIMEGRMELRAFGVETMQSDLVTVWRQYISPEPASAGASPLVQYLVRLIQSTKLVDYLVGVDSHPQLISRSSNIIGFLIVTSTYTNSETDVIWKTITDSQDSRIIAEVLTMLIKTLYMHPLTSPCLLYICSKVLDLTLDRFDARMLDLCEGLLLRTSSDKPIEHAGKERLDAVLIRLCVRLIRESTVAEDIPVDQKTHMQTFGSKHLERFIKAGISEVDRMEIYERCIQDIGEVNQFTTGSFQVLNALVPLQDSQETWKLATDFDLTRLVIKDLLHTVNNDENGFSNSLSHHGLTSKIAMLSRLVDMAPDTITPELGSSLWNEILLSKKLGQSGLKAVWSMMVNTLKNSSKPNLFLDRCIYEYLPGLKPSDYSVDLLAFVKHSIMYELRFYPPSLPSANEVITIPGMDRIWTIILNAPPASIENDAMKFAVEVYLDHTIMLNSPRSAVELTHIFIANRCIDQLKSAATALTESEKITANGSDFKMDEGSEQKLSADEIRFRRSLIFLRQFLYGLRTRPHYSPPRGTPPRLPDRPLKGEAIEITWQAFNGSSSSKINHLTIGELSTSAELVEKFSQATGFSKLTTISGGQRIDLLKDPDVLIKDLKLQPGLLIVQKAADAREVAQDNRRQAFTPVDFEVLQHFNEMYELLALKADLAREIFEFLVVFPPQERITSIVRSEEHDQKDLFPLQKPFVALYSFNALTACLREEAIEDTPNSSFVSHSIKILVGFLLSSELSGLLSQNPLVLNLAASAVECLLLTFTIHKENDESNPIIQEPTIFVKQLLRLVEAVRAIPANPTNMLRIQKFKCNSFALLLEGSVKDHAYWIAVKGEVQFDQLFEAMLLQEQSRQARIEVSDRVHMICGSSKLQKYSTRKSSDATDQLAESPTRIDMLATIWESLSSTIPKTLNYAFQSAEFFKTTLWVFNSIADKSPKDMSFSHYLRQWSEVMFQHQTEEFIGREIVDEVIHGFALLLELCIELADACKIQLDTFDLGEKLLAKYLFPELSPDDEDPVVAQAPVMHSMTRQKLFSIITLLCKRNSSNLARTFEFMSDLIPRDESYGPNSSIERSNMIRATEGYAGLKNLSNTCYLNSLMTQLFMNVEFREFMLGLHIVDPESSQKLLGETQRLFAGMQGSWSKHVDPQEFVESIRTYDNEAIDVTVQMDVDEFYNLLFDRWEAQVVDSEDKKRFRSFYGGQLVQQIKSKECSHISERLEPFSAIQCDIKGKVSLEESLQAYVEGEIMQGDNKYSCTACGRHVDAVKRACLKDVPDNLIFHLKRFDFDITTLMRSKINDVFQFPPRIDMTPYKVEHLSDSNSFVEPDVFELVGVLVHSGTAESGHYYSYTRERPSSSNIPTWVDFNDSDVSRFDPSTIADQCFGGSGDAAHSMGNMQINKAWNAYMLFYQRVSKIEESKKRCQSLRTNYPIQVPVPRPLSNAISLYNEVLIRTYCLLDKHYILFVEGLLETLRYTASESPSRRDLDGLAMCVGIETYEQLVARTKEYTAGEDIFGELCLLLKRSPHAALIGLQWAHSQSTALGNIILRVSNNEIRRRGITLILDCVRIALKTLDNDLEESKKIIRRSHIEIAIGNVIAKLRYMWTQLHAVPRAWDDYFEFILALSEIGPDVTQLLLKHDFLLRCLQLVWLAERDDKKQLRMFYPTYIRLQEKGRRYPQENMIKALRRLLSNVDLSISAQPDDVPRSRGSNGKFVLNASESDLIWTFEPDGSISMLLRLLTSEQFKNLQTSCSIVGLFTAAEPEAGHLNNIIKTLEAGLRFSPADLCIPFLVATVEFCENAPDRVVVANIIDYVAQGVESINNRGGLEHYEFFQTLANRTNKRLELEPDWFAFIVIEKIPDYAPTLLMDPDRLTRQQILEFVNLALFAPDTEDFDEDERASKTRIGREFTRSCVDKIKRVYSSERVQNTDPRTLQGFKQVLPYGLQRYFSSSSEEDQEFIAETKGIVEYIEQITADVSDDLISESELPSPEEWEVTSALASDSEMGIAGSP